MSGSRSPSPTWPLGASQERHHDDGGGEQYQGDNRRVGLFPVHEAADALERHVGGQHEERDGHRLEGAALLRLIGLAMAQARSQAQADQYRRRRLDCPAPGSVETLN